MSRTFHVYFSDGMWVMQRLGRPAKTYRTKKEAVTAARKAVNRIAYGQVVVHAKDDRILDYKAYNMRPILKPRKKGPNSDRIAQVIHEMVMEELRSEYHALAQPVGG